MGSFSLETFFALPKHSEVEGDGVACFHLHSLPAFQTPANKNGKHFGSTQGSQALALFLAFITNKCEEWFGGSSAWWTENWRKKKKKCSESNQNMSVGLRKRFNKVNEAKNNPKVLLQGGKVEKFLVLFWGGRGCFVFGSVKSFPPQNTSSVVQLTVAHHEPFKIKCTNL